MLGVPILPGSQFIASYDAGRGQRYYLFGSATPFAEVVAYYRTMLKQRGTLLFDVPGTHQFEVGRFREETMAFPPGVTVKDYVSAVSAGYPNPKPATQPAHFSTIVQIVPVTSGANRAEGLPLHRRAGPLRRSLDTSSSIRLGQTLPPAPPRIAASAAAR